MSYPGNVNLKDSVKEGMKEVLTEEQKKLAQQQKKTPKLIAVPIIVALMLYIAWPNPSLIQHLLGVVGLTVAHSSPSLYYIAFTLVFAFFSVEIYDDGFKHTSVRFILKYANISLFFSRALKFLPESLSARLLSPSTCGSV